MDVWLPAATAVESSWAAFAGGPLFALQLANVLVSSGAYARMRVLRAASPAARPTLVDFVKRQARFVVGARGRDILALDDDDGVRGATAASPATALVITTHGAMAPAAGVPTITTIFNENAGSIFELGL